MHGIIKFSLHVASYERLVDLILKSNAYTAFFETSPDFWRFYYFYHLTQTFMGIHVTVIFADASTYIFTG